LKNEKGGDAGGKQEAESAVRRGKSSKMKHQGLEEGRANENVEIRKEKKRGSNAERESGVRRGKSRENDNFTHNGDG
jgi:hypothetical protein